MSESEVIDVTDRELWVEALSMAASEGTFGSFVADDPYGTRDRMLAYFDRLREQARKAGK